MNENTLSTRDRLLEAAVELLWTGSFQSTSVERICRKADVRKGSFYHYFASKSDLAVEAVSETWSRVQADMLDEIFSENLTGLQRLRRLVEQVAAFRQREFAARRIYIGCPFGGIGQEMSHSDESLRLVVNKVFEQHVDYFERALTQAVDEDAIARGNLRQRARDLLAYMEGALLLAKVAKSPQRFTDAMDGFIRLVGRKEPADSARD